MRFNLILLLSMLALCSGIAQEQKLCPLMIEDEIDPEKIIHIQKHSTPFYSSEAFKYRNEVIETNGENNTFHVGAYLGIGLHEGAVVSALRVSKILGGKVL